MSRPGIGGATSTAGRMKAEDAKRLKELEKENARLKKLVADKAVDIDITPGPQAGAQSKPA